MKKRLEAVRALAQQGFMIGFRFDPMIYHEDYQTHYKKFYEEAFSCVKSSQIHSVTTGAFRLPKPIYKNMNQIISSPLLSSLSKEKEGMLSYDESVLEEMLEFSKARILEYTDKSKLFIC